MVSFTLKIHMCVQSWHTDIETNTSIPFIMWTHKKNTHHKSDERERAAGTGADLPDDKPFTY